MAKRQVGSGFPNLALRRSAATFDAALTGFLMRPPLA
jgi:hypothetical protein